MAAPDVGPVVTALEAALTPIALVGTAVLLIYAIWVLLRGTRAMIDEDAALDAEHREWMQENVGDPDDDDDDYDPDFMVLGCGDCGVNSADDSRLFVDPETGEPDYDDGCPQCGGVLYRV